MKTVLIIGYGDRASTYTTYLKENVSEYCVIAVAEPNEARRKNCQTRFNISDKYCYLSWEQALELKIADLVFITTLDHQHIEPTLCACKLKYDIVLEKPMGINLDECMQIYQASKEYNVKITLCHVMRYHPLYQKARKIITAQLGKLLQVYWLQPINWHHFVKSYIRHPYWSMEEYGPLASTKGVHDLDLIYWFLDAVDAEVQHSTGDKVIFTLENAPEGSAERCTDCKYQNTCEASAIKNYAEFPSYRKFVSDRPHPTREDAIRDMEDGPYNRCAYKTGSNVQERITTIFKTFNKHQFTTDVTYVMSAFHNDICWRTATFIGTNATLELNEKDSTLKIIPVTRGNGFIPKPKIITVDTELPSDTRMTGHNGADYHFSKDIFSDNWQTLIRESMSSHILAFDIGNSLSASFSWCPRRISRIFNQTKVLVSTKNNEKLQATQDAFEIMGYQPIITCSATDNGISDGQPYGIDGTFQGVQQRIATLPKDLRLETDFIVSIENGISVLQSNEGSILLDIPIVQIVDTKNNKKAVQIGQSRPIPLDEIRQMKRVGTSEIERGAYVAKWYRARENLTSRGETIRDTLLMAMRSI
uniref:Oxidoreductase family protein n=1 Tax=Marseillevirus LCMAC202 TaxID=2506606 RepID=A0A481YYL1_9VIRU|nr:MAG: oxidoreductase family protein [Marseillevirus LCMAC202]